MPGILWPMDYEVKDTDPWIRIRFSLLTDHAIDLGIVTERTGLVPDRLFKAGDRRTTETGRTHDPYSYSRWQVLICDERTVMLSELLERAVDVLEPQQDTIREVMAEFGLDAQLGIHTFMSHECAGPGKDAPVGSTPDGQFSKKVIAFLAGLTATIDLDLYVTGDPNFGARYSRNPAARSRTAVSIGLR